MQIVCIFYSDPRHLDGRSRRWSARFWSFQAPRVGGGISSPLSKSQLERIIIKKVTAFFLLTVFVAGHGIKYDFPVP